GPGPAPPGGRPAQRGRPRGVAGGVRRGHPRHPARHRRHGRGPRQRRRLDPLGHGPGHRPRLPDMTEPYQVCELPTASLGRRVRVHAQVTSTTSLAAGYAADPANHGLVILADEQTSGRGQHGRTWLAPPRGGVLLSVLLFPPPALRRPVVLT